MLQFAQREKVSLSSRGLFFSVLPFTAGREIEVLRMGNQYSKLSPPQREAYLQAEGTLFMGNFQFLKGELETFIYWVFQHFSNTNRISVLSGSF